MLCDHLPRTRLAYLPTPLEATPRLSEALGGPRLLIKRDDRTGLAFGGNKPRIFEFVIGEALAQGCDVLITPAGLQSNHLREVTAAANKLGLKSVLVVFGNSEGVEPQGNLLLFHLLGADIRFYPSTLEDAYHDPRMLAYCEEIRAEFVAKGHKPYLVHFDSDSGPLGSASHVNAAEEMAAQFAEHGGPPDLVYVPCGGGVTTSGFALGFKHLGLPTRVVGCSAIRPGDQVRGDIVRYGNGAAEKLGLATRLGPEDFDVLDCTAGGYGVVTPEVSEAIRLVAQSEGLFLDPTYNGKAMAGMIAQIRSGELVAGQTAVLVHTGGTPALFAVNRDLMAG